MTLIAPRMPGRSPRSQRGAGLVESTIVLPTLLLLVLGMWQAALGYQAKSSVNYATFEAARAGAVNNASVTSITNAFNKAMISYYGGGNSVAELADSYARATGDTALGMRVEVLSPTKESFDDFNSPALKAKYKTDEPVIPNVGLDELSCPRDVPGCKSDPKSNASGQTLQDANLLKLRITYGIPKEKQMPMVGRFYTWALGKLKAGEGDAFKQGLIDAGRIPVVSHVVVRMQSDPIRNSAMASIPGAGNNGTPTDPGPPASSPGLPSCPWWDPSCSICTDGAGKGKCELPPPTCPAAG
ncbi:MAG TPA: TadE/TadG family type IV pilus assembly protein [Roseateles sp.]